MAVETPSIERRVKKSAGIAATTAFLFALMSIDGNGARAQQEPIAVPTASATTTPSVEGTPEPLKTIGEVKATVKMNPYCPTEVIRLPTDELMIGSPGKCRKVGFTVNTITNKVADRKEISTHREYVVIGSVDNAECASHRHQNVLPCFKWRERWGETAPYEDYFFERDGDGNVVEEEGIKDAQRRPLPHSFYPALKFPFRATRENPKKPSFTGEFNDYYGVHYFVTGISNGWKQAPGRENSSIKTVELDITGDPQGAETPFSPRYKVRAYYAPIETGGPGLIMSLGTSRNFFQAVLEKSIKDKPDSVVSGINSSILNAEGTGSAKP